MTQLVPTQPIQLPATAELYRQATDVAGVCKEIVLKTAMAIQGRNYVKVEGWQSIATAHGCTASARDVEVIPGEGVRAIGEIRRMSDGAVIATAEGFVGEDEPTWFGGEIQTRNGPKTLPKRPLYAIRAMAQTRAISRACRTAFAHVVVLMDAGLSTTPAEEVPSEGFSEPQESRQERSKPQKASDYPPEQRAAVIPQDWRDCVIHFGKNEGRRLGDLDSRSLAWYCENWQPKPYKGRISDHDSVLREMLDKAREELSQAEEQKRTDYADAAQAAAVRRGEVPVTANGNEEDEIPGL